MQCLLVVRTVSTDQIRSLWYPFSVWESIAEHNQRHCGILERYTTFSIIEFNAVRAKYEVAGYRVRWMLQTSFSCSNLMFIEFWDSGIVSRARQTANTRELTPHQDDFASPAPSCPRPMCKSYWAKTTTFGAVWEIKSSRKKIYTWFLWVRIPFYWFVIRVQWTNWKKQNITQIMQDWPDYYTYARTLRN